MNIYTQVYKIYNKYISALYEQTIYSILLNATTPRIAVPFLLITTKCMK